jgi:peptidoglycan hydrolase-like protein with peptidoglycan-binding domain
MPGVAHDAVPEEAGPLQDARQASPEGTGAGSAAALTPESVLFLQRHAGNASVTRMLARRGAPVHRSSSRLLLRDRYDEGTPGSRPGMDVGDTGPGVTLLQHMIGANETGVFDAQTRKAVDEFQQQQGWKPSGVGPMTWDRLDNHEGTPGNRPNLRFGFRGPGVRLLQKVLGVSQTGFFGKKTLDAVTAFQRLQGWAPTGVGPDTWRALDQTVVANEMGVLSDVAHPLRATWHSSGPGAKPGNPGRLPSGYLTHFAQWASAATEDPAFTVGPATVINCWEMVLYSAYLSKEITWAKIHEIYTYAGPHDWYVELANRLSATAVTWDRRTKKPAPKRGDVVMFDGASHVALATGSGTHIYSFWPPPDIAFLAGGTPDRVKDTTIEALLPACDAVNASTGNPPCVVTVGSPSVW